MSSDQGKLSSIKVEIQSKKWIKPATPTPFHLQKLKLSSIDQLQLPIFVQPIFYFHISSSKTDVIKTTPERLLRLEESLSKVLTLYYPFAGRIYDEDDSLVSCQDQGVAFVVAKVDHKLDELADGEYDTKVLLSGLESLPISNPLVLVQVNIFTCGGLAIGIGVSHKVGDMFTISTFMNAWATTCLLGTLDEVVRPSFSFSSLLPASRSDIHFSKPPPSRINTTTPPEYIMKRYIFTGEAIARIRSSSIIISEESSYYTRVELVMAVLTRSLTNIEQPKHKPLVITQPMNFRLKTELPIEDNSCGNLLTPVVANCGELENGLLSWEIPVLANLIQHSIKNVAFEMGKVRDWGELSDKIIKATLEFYEQVKNGDSVNLVMFSSWCRFHLYEVDFGWGKPCLVSTAPLPCNFIWLMDCKSDIRGIEALVCLKEQDMARFRQEQDILGYASF